MASKGNTREHSLTQEESSRRSQ